MNYAGGIVYSVEDNSIANELNICSGDIITKINGYKLRDILDYRFHIVNEVIELTVQHLDGSIEIYDIEKDFDDDLGITFENAVFDKIKICNNKCIFCFIDQQPEGLRDSLYVKDDDYRLSYLQGNYITLTNLTEEDRQRIEQVRPGPLYVSVHATIPEVRVQLLKNPKSGNILEELSWLEKLGIPVHAQIVLCPEYNDRQVLDKTLSDLAKKSNVESIAVVPYGNTQFRKDNHIREVTSEDAHTVLSQCDHFNQTHKKHFVFPSDEFYILTGKDFPQYSYYKQFPQLEDGVGTARLFLETFVPVEKFLPHALSHPCKYCVITGKIGKGILRSVVDRLNQITNLQIDLIAIDSKFWGEEITVTGLIVGEDIISTVKQTGLQYDKIIIPAVMLRKGTQQFMDNLMVKDVEQALNMPVDVIEEYYNAKAFVDSVLAKQILSI